MERPSLSLEGRSALVVGGTYGIGETVAAQLSAHGAQVAINGRSSGQAALERLQALGGRAVLAHGDMTRYEDMVRAVEQTVDAFGGLDILVVSGKPSSARPGLFLEADPATFLDYFRDRTVSRFYAAHAAAKEMKRRGKGKIVFLTTDAGRTPTPAETLIGASSAAVVFGTRALARELARDGIRVNAVSLSLTTGTPVHDAYRSAWEAGDRAVILKAFHKLEQRAAFGLNTTEDVAAAVLFLASDASDKISGATISVNGGVSFPG